MVSRGGLLKHALSNAYSGDVPAFTQARVTRHSRLLHVRSILNYLSVRQFHASVTAIRAKVEIAAFEIARCQCAVADAIACPAEDESDLGGDERAALIAIVERLSSAKQALLHAGRQARVQPRGSRSRARLIPTAGRNVRYALGWQGARDMGGVRAGRVDEVGSRQVAKTAPNFDEATRWSCQRPARVRE